MTVALPGGSCSPQFAQERHPCPDCRSVVGSGMTDSALGPICVNRAPVLTLWAAAVAERLGHPPDTALSLAGAVAGTAVRARARRLGIAATRDHAKDAAAPSKPKDTTRLLGREVQLTHDADGVVLADAGKGKPAPAAPVAAYIAKAFGGHLGEVRAAMAALKRDLVIMKRSRRWRSSCGTRPG